MQDFKPAASEDPKAPPQPPLFRAPEDWKFVERDGRRYTREFNTMPQWGGSCWYYLRFCDPRNEAAFVGQEADKYWMKGHPRMVARGGQADDRRDARPTDGTGVPPVISGGVDLYVGGVEHAVLHLLYARFWHKVLFDLGHVSTPEPFGRLFNQGYIQAYAYTDTRGIYVPAEEVEEKDGRFFHKGQEVKQEFGKMGKSLKNAVAPDEICAEYGCDTMRLYEMYMGPLDQSKIWRTRDILGSHRFLQRLWRNFVDEATGQLRVSEGPAPIELRRLLHKTIKRVTEAMDGLSFNVAIAALIELNNELVGRDTIPREVARAMVLLLAPMAPHICEELWKILGQPQTLAYEPWPVYDPALLVADTLEYPVQVNGKLRGKISVPAQADEAALRAAVSADEKLQPHMAGKTIRKFIVVKGRMVNVVVG